MKLNLRKRTYSLALAAAVGACSGSPTDTGPYSCRCRRKPVVKTTVDYEHALRAASIKLTGNLPSLAEIKQVRDTSDQKGEYEKLVDTYMKRPTFAAQIVDFFRDSFNNGGQRQINGQNINMDLARRRTPRAGGEISRSPTWSRRAPNTCQTLDTGRGDVHVDGLPERERGRRAHRRRRAGAVLLEHGLPSRALGAGDLRLPASSRPRPPARHAAADGRRRTPRRGRSSQSPAGRRRARASTSRTTRRSSAPTATATMNHQSRRCSRNFDDAGAPMARRPQVPVPIREPDRGARRLAAGVGEDRLVAHGSPAADIPALGAAIAADPEFARCMATRVWNWALSRPDVVDDDASITPDWRRTLATELTASNWNLKPHDPSVFTSDAFVRF